MAVGERDPFTGHMTTGHEWNGIKELNSPVPRIIWAFLICAVSFAIIWSRWKKSTAHTVFLKRKHAWQPVGTSGD